MAKDIRATGKISNMEIQVNARLSKNIEASAKIGQTVMVNGVSDYNKLKNKPRIEGVELVGDLTFPQLNFTRITNSELEEILKI